MALAEDVFELVAEHRGMRREKLHLTDRLCVDLGMDGDDAVEFFEAFEEKFEVDLSYLKDHWSEYFGPEGISGSGPFSFIIVCVIPAFLLGVFFHLRTWLVVVLGLGTMISAMLVIGAINGKRERENPTSRQISISDLITSVQIKSFVHR